MYTAEGIGLALGPIPAVYTPYRTADGVEQPVLTKLYNENIGGHLAFVLYIMSRRKKKGYRKCRSIAVYDAPDYY